MARYEFSEGSSNKFWEVELDGATVTVRFGRVGTSGQTQTKNFASEGQAKREHDKLVAEKTKKGYKPVADGGSSGGDASAAASPAASARAGAGAPQPLSGADGNAELEAALLANPDDDAAYAVYADWLQGRADPRGELIALQLAGGGAKAKKDRAAAIIAANEAKWFGSAAKQKDCYTLEWKNGFVRAVTVRHNYYDSDEDVALDKVLGKILDSPVGWLVETIRVGAWINDEGQAEYGPVAKAIAARPRPSVRTLYLADFERGDDTEISWSELGNLGSLWAAIPNVRHVELQAGSMTLGKVALPHARHFEVRTGGLSRDSARAISRAALPAVEKLVVWFGSHNYGGDARLEDIKDLLDAKTIPNVKHLGLMNCEFTDAICEALPASRVLAQLETLDLSMGMMTVRGAQHIRDHAAAFAHLAELNVERNYLSEAGRRALKGVCKSVESGKQRGDENAEYRYVAVGE